MTTLVNDDDFTLIDGRKVLKDGKKITVGLTLVDNSMVEDTGALHRPGTRLSTDATATETRSTAYSGYLADLGDAWRHPGGDEKAPVITDSREAAIAQRDRELADAWKGGVNV
ncbi:MAG: hypothetical protein WDO17_15660 [Alphaproteobacteria bacterium]